ncbi:hypothetical protein ACFVH0_13275 [Streptomyces sp. NPDC127117]|uniref:hypothetical protein n=1 Tax=Streptomyces sp. NPDC127117 TaxID=3345368 RepID=UPI0036339CE2
MPELFTHALTALAEALLTELPAQLITSLATAAVAGWWAGRRRSRAGRTREVKDLEE